MKQQSVNPKLLAALGLLVAVAAYFMVIRPQGARLGEARSERAAAEQQLTLARQQAAATPTTVASDEPTAVDLAVPADPGLSGLLRQLEGIGRETGLRHTTVTPSPAAVVPGVPGASLQVSIGATGTRAGAYAYLNRLALLPRLVVVEQVGLTSGEGQPAAGASAAASSSASGSSEVTMQLLARVFTTEIPGAAS